MDICPFNPYPPSQKSHLGPSGQTNVSFKLHGQMKQKKFKTKINHVFFLKIIRTGDTVDVVVTIPHWAQLFKIVYSAEKMLFSNISF